MGETQMWWRVSVFFNLGKIEAREIVRATPSFVVYMAPGWKGEEERREGRYTQYYRWLPSEERAVAFAREILTGKRDGLLSQLERAESALAAFNEAHPLPATEEQ